MISKHSINFIILLFPFIGASQKSDSLLYGNFHQLTTYHDIKKLLISKPWEESSSVYLRGDTSYLAALDPRTFMKPSMSRTWHFLEEDKVEIAFQNEIYAFKWKLNPDSVIELYSQNQLIKKLFLSSISSNHIEIIKVDCENFSYQKSIHGIYQTSKWKTKKHYQLALKSSNEFSFITYFKRKPIQLEKGFYKIENSKIILTTEAQIIYEKTSKKNLPNIPINSSFIHFEEREVEITKESDQVSLRFIDEDGEEWMLEKMGG
ncbi:MAG: hypothetical protein R2879_18765 [Saprospiraceae bacterium]